MFNLFNAADAEPDEPWGGDPLPPFTDAEKWHFDIDVESGTRCAVCGLYHADQWQCDPSIPNPWGGEE